MARCGPTAALVGDRADRRDRRRRPPTVYASRKPKKYTATARCCSSNSTSTRSCWARQIVNNVDPTRQAATNQALVGAPDGRSHGGQSAAHQLRPGDQRRRVRLRRPVRRALDQGHRRQPDVAAAESPTPTSAHYIQFRKSAAQNQLATAEQLVSSKLAAIPPASRTAPSATQLATERNQLELLASLPDGRARQVVQTRIVPHSPSYPTPKKQAILGARPRAARGEPRTGRRCSSAATAASRRSRRSRSIYGMPMLGTVPESGIRTPRGLASPRDEEAFLMMRAQLRYFDVDRNVQRVHGHLGRERRGQVGHLAQPRPRRRADRRHAGPADRVRHAAAEPASAHRPRAPWRVWPSCSATPRTWPPACASSSSTPEDEFGCDRPINSTCCWPARTPPNPLELLESSRMRELLDVRRRDVRRGHPRHAADRRHQRRDPARAPGRRPARHLPRSASPAATRRSG